MDKKPKVTAIIAAAGSSARMGFPKLLHNLDGDLSVLSLSVKAMFENEFIDEVIVVTKKEFFDIALKECERFSLNKKYRVVEGADTRQESVKNGVLASSVETEFFAIHDGARPFVTQEEISCVISDAFVHGYSILGVPVKDTIKVAQNGVIVSTPKRETLFAAHTPQVFKADVYKKALECENLNDFTDDASLLESMGIKVHLTIGKYTNKKITTIDDLKG